EELRLIDATGLAAGKKTKRSPAIGGVAFQIVSYSIAAPGKTARVIFRPDDYRWAFSSPVTQPRARPATGRSTRVSPLSAAHRPSQEQRAWKSPRQSRRRSHCAAAQRT